MSAAADSRGASTVAIAARLLMLVAIVALPLFGWHYATEILGPDSPPALDEQDLLAVTDTSVTLSPNPDARAAGIETLEWPGGFGELTDHLGGDPTRIVRRFRLQSGAPPRPGKASARAYAFAADPRSALRLDYHEVAIAGALGPNPAWRIDPTDSLIELGVASGATTASAAVAGSDWMIYVHGRGAVRAQALGVAPLFLRLGWTCLVPSYRGDAIAAREGHGRYRLGETEWMDLEAAVRYALESGARRLVVFGNSMGGTIVLQFLRHSPLGSRVNGVVLEAPVLRWRPVFDLAARERGVPAPITSLAMWIAARRASIRWDDLDELAHAREFRVPMLVFHGTADTTVPLALSDSLAARRPDLVTLVRVMDAGHSRCWNVAPSGYEATIASWLNRRVAASGAAAMPAAR